MRSLVCALVILVGCSKGSGVQLDIQSAPDGVNYVRVYISTLQLGDVPSLSVPPLEANGQVGSDLETQNPDVYVRGPDNENDIYKYTPGKPLDLKFEAGSNANTSFPAVIVIGFDTDGPTGKPLASAVVTNLAFQPNTVNEYAVQLGNAGTIDNSAEHLFLWSPDLTTPLTDAACVGVVGETTAFIVSGGDIDCDGDPDGSTSIGTYECNKYVYKDVDSMASLAAGQCIPEGTADSGQCRIGGGTCVDGSGPASTSATCNTADNICLPTLDCQCAVDPGQTQLGCLVDEAAKGDTSFLGYSCSIGTMTDPSGAACSIPVPRPPTGGFGCLPTGGNNQTGIASDGTGTFSDSVQINGVSYALTVTKSCDISLMPMGSSMSTNATGVLLRLDLDDPAHPSSLIVPIAMSFTGAACNTNSTCTVDAALIQPPVTACEAGWAVPATDSKLVGRSPTLNATMTEIFFIGSDAGEDTVETATRASTSAAWSVPTDVALGVIVDAQDVHLSDDGMTLYVVDDTGTIEEFTRTSTMASSPWMAGGALSLSALTINAFAPDANDTDAIVATTNGSLYELPDGTTLGSNTTESPFSTGQTPFLTDDDDDLWYSDLNGSDGSDYAVFVSSRGTASEAFSTGVELPELGTSSKPMGMWVSPERTTIFFASDNAGQLLDGPHIYSTTR